MIDKLTFDVGGSSIKFIHFGANGHIVEKGEIEYINFKKNQEKKLDYVLKLIADKIKHIKFDFYLGIVFPGIIDNKNLLIKTKSTIIDVDINIKEYFKNINKIKKLIIENDAKSAAFAEFKIRDSIISNLVHVTLGTAIGGGIVIDGKIYGGKKGYAGEFSKLFSSILKNEKMSYEILSTTQNCLKYKKKNIDGITLMSLYKNEDIVAKQIVNNWLDSLSRFLLNLDYIYAPDLITIGGGICKNNLFFEILQKKFKKNRIEKNEFVCNLEKAYFYNDAGCYGIKYLLEIED